MNVFVTGATGVLGRPLVKRLIEAGHQVRALSRSEQNENLLRGLGAEPVAGDPFDATSLRKAMAGCRAVIHAATKIPPSERIKSPASWAENDRLRREGTHHLVEAALAEGVDICLYPSVVFFYPDRGAEWITGDLAPASAWFLDSTLAAEAEVERFTNFGRRGVVLRLGHLYGPTAGETRDVLNYARKGMGLVLGRDDAYYPALWVDDAAAALVRALERAPAGVYDVVDDEPLTRKELLRAMAKAVGRRSLMKVPGFLARMATGEVLASVMSRSLRISNERFSTATGWCPTMTSAREGFAHLGCEHPGHVLSGMV